MKNRIIFFFLLYLTSSFYCTAEPVKVQLLSTIEKVGDENSLVLGLFFDIDPEWKIYAPTENSSSSLGYPPKIEWHYLKNIQDVSLHWPKAEEEQWQQYQSAVYHNKIIVPLTVLLKQPGTAIELDFTLHFLACAQSCLPISKHFTFHLPEGLAKETPEATEIYQAMVPKRLNFALMIVLAIIGGLILNLMPCVLPVLTLKLMSLTNQKNRENFSKSALNIFSGIIISFLLLALITLSIRQLGISIGWGFHFQNIYFLTVIGLIMLFFSFNLFGFFEFRLPFFVNRFLPTPSTATSLSYGQDFLNGMLATLLSTPCSAPFLGTAVSYALTRGGVYILVIFLSLGIGFGLPYLVIASLPLTAIPLPRPGQWMVRLRQLLGFGLLITSLWLFAIAIKQTSFYSHIFPVSSRETLLWKEFDPSIIDKKVEEGFIVFVDITADWCMTCLYNETFVLNKPKLEKILHHPKVLLMKGDWTKRDERIFNFLKKNNRFGIPFNKMYGPHCPQGVLLPELLSQQSVMEMLEKCGLPPSADLSSDKRPKKL